MLIVSKLALLKLKNSAAARPQTVLISTRSGVKKRWQHPVKASFGFIIFGFHWNIFMTDSIVGGTKYG